MSARARPMVLDNGVSADADATASRATRERVRAVITTILRERGALTDEEIGEEYAKRAGSHPLVPVVTPQRIRTARASLVRDGLVRDSHALGFSRLGNRATVWTLA